MAGPGSQSSQPSSRPPGKGARVLIIDAPYYEHISAQLLEGAIAELEAAGAVFERVVVPGALELPLALAQAVKAGLIPGDAAHARFDGCVVLGCVIRGETTHYETVCDNANHWLMEIATRHAIPLGNAILTVETEEQAIARAEGGRMSKGASSARACLALIEQAGAFAGARA
jgi:6,7-dimethyl-8-ribityllumazine synthase